MKRWVSALGAPVELCVFCIYVAFSSGADWSACWEAALTVTRAPCRFTTEPGNLTELYQKKTKAEVPMVWLDERSIWIWINIMKINEEEYL